MQETDKEIIVNYLNGDKNAFTEIVNRYLKPIFNFTYRFIGNEKVAEDITQDVFLKAWKNLEKFDFDKSFKTWIFSIAKNTSIDYLRKRKDIPLSAFDDEDGVNVIADNLTDTEPKADDKFGLLQNKMHLEKIIDELTIVQKEVIILKYVNDLSLSEVAEIMEMSPDTVKSHHRRAIIKMRKSLTAPRLSK